MLRAGGAVGGVPRVVVIDGAVEEVPERTLVVLGHPQVEGAESAPGVTSSLHDTVSAATRQATIDQVLATLRVSP